METTCLAHELEVVKTEASEFIESYETSVNKVLDSINEFRHDFEFLTDRITKINEMVRDFVCEYEQSDAIVISARELIGSLRRFIGKAKNHRFYPGYKSTLRILTETVDDFEEYMQDFKFRHDQKSQEQLQELLKGFSISI